jgi:hypothetical protein
MAYEAVKSFFDRLIVAIMPDSVADYLVATGQLHIRPVPIRRKAEPYGLVFRTGTEVTPVMQIFIDACLANVVTGASEECGTATQRSKLVQANYPAADPRREKGTDGKRDIIVQSQHPPRRSGS